jgi:methionyl-tRNA synthetase
LVSINPYSQDDLNFDWEQFSTKINSELIGNLGNLVNRILGFTLKTFDGVVPVPEDFDGKDSESEKKIKSLADDIGKLMQENHLDRALKQLMEFSAHFNQYFQHKEPWKKEPGTNTCIYLSINAVRSIAICLHSFLPKSSQKIWSQLGLEGNVSDISWNEMSELTLNVGHKIGAVEPLFSKVESSDIEKEQSKLGN